MTTLKKFKKAHSYLYPDPTQPPANCRPMIILLSVIRKMLAIIMIRRTSSKLQEKIPPAQAAYMYQSGRGTTEHVFALKVPADKAISSSDYEITYYY